MRLLIGIVVGWALLSGCQTLEERLAKRVGCNPKKLTVQKQIHVSAYNQYNFTCEGKKYTCRDAPFASTCDEGVGAGKRKSKKAELDDSLDL